MPDNSLAKLSYLLISALLLIHLNSDAITIQGDEKYKEQVSKCLDLLAKKAKTEFKLVELYIGVISQDDKSGMMAWEKPPRFTMSDRTAFYSLTWCAGSIAHDAYHAYLYKKYEPATGEFTDYEAWGGFKAEKQALDYQLGVMYKVGATKHEIEYLKSLDGTHGDINGDGILTDEDYEKRDW